VVPEPNREWVRLESLTERVSPADHGYMVPEPDLQDAVRPTTGTWCPSLTYVFQALQYTTALYQLWNWLDVNTRSPSLEFESQFAPS
jgi:hypothetical protein